jgi:hypothetical protein
MGGWGVAGARALNGVPLPPAAPAPRTSAVADASKLASTPLIAWRRRGRGNAQPRGGIAAERAANHSSAAATDISATTITNNDKPLTAYPMKMNEPPHERQEQRQAPIRSLSSAAARAVHRNFLGFFGIGPWVFA